MDLDNNLMEPDCKKIEQYCQVVTQKRVNKVRKPNSIKKQKVNLY